MLFTEENGLDFELDTLLESVIIDYAGPFEKVAEKFKQKREEANKKKYKKLEETIINNVNLVLTYDQSYWDGMFNKYRTFLIKYKNGLYKNKIVPFATYGPVFYFPINYKYAIEIARNFWSTPLNKFDEHERTILDNIGKIEKFIEKIFNLEVLYSTLLADKTEEEIMEDNFLMRINDFCKDYSSSYKALYAAQLRYATSLLNKYEKENKKYGDG